MQLCGKAGHEARVMFLCFGVMLIDRTLSTRPETGLDRFQSFLNAMPACAAPLRKALVSRGHELMFGDEDDEELFFDQRRLDILERLTDPAESTDIQTSKLAEGP